MVGKSTFHYKPRRRGQADLEKRIKEIAETRMRYGYRRVHVVLLREGWMINIKRTRRIYAELGLQLRAKSPKRRVKAKLREDRCPALQPNETWAMDFVHDQLVTGRTFRVLTVIDQWSRESVLMEANVALTGQSVVDALEAVGGQCVALYPEKPIYDIPGFPLINGQELVDNLLKQIEPFSPTFHFNEQVEGLEVLGDAPERRVAAILETAHHRAQLLQVLARGLAHDAAAGLVELHRHRGALVAGHARQRAGE